MPNSVSKSALSPLPKKQNQSWGPVVALAACVIGALALAKPACDDYLRKSEFLSVMIATNAERQAVETCFKNGDCVAGPAIDTRLLGRSAIPCVGAAANCAPKTEQTSSVSVSATGVITAKATNKSRLREETYVLTPFVYDGRLQWTQSGTCKTADGGHSICED